MSTLKPIKIWGQGGPNPPKIPLICDFLSLPYEFAPNFSFPQVKSEEYLAINPNGRMPAIQDPNHPSGQLTLWESGAIIEYLCETYDKEKSIGFEKGSAEYFHAKQWLFFQASGQGPYFGQAVWFTRFHKEKLPSAIERYMGEINRVTGVLELHLSKQEAGSDGPWLVGGKMSYADLAFIPWQIMASGMPKESGFDAEEYPTVKKWLENMKKNGHVQKCVEGLMKGH